MNSHQRRKQRRKGAGHRVPDPAVEQIDEQREPWIIRFLGAFKRAARVW